MLALPNGRGRQSYNGSIGFAPAVGSKSTGPHLEMTTRAGYPLLAVVNVGTMVDQDRRSIASIAARASATS
jgi:hypothetical protein